MLINEMCLETKKCDRVLHTVGPACRGRWVRGLVTEDSSTRSAKEREMFGTESRDVGGVELA